MAVSPFQFTEPLMIRSMFEIKRDMKNDDDVKVHLQRNIFRIQETPNLAIVELTIQLNKQGDQERENACFVAEIKMQSKFVWIQDLKEDQVKDLLEKNAVALLISYARPILAQMTNASPLPTYHLPFININELNNPDQE